MRRPDSAVAVVSGPAILLTMTSCASNHRGRPLAPRATSVRASGATQQSKALTVPHLRRHTAGQPGLVPADGGRPAAGICASPHQRVVTVVVNPDTPAPRCTYVRADQVLRVVNHTDAFNQPARLVTVKFADRPQVTLTVGEAVLYSETFGAYLAPGAHDIHLSVFSGGGAQVYLR